MKNLVGIRSVVLVVLLLAAGMSGAATVYITEDGNGDQPTIQAGLDACADGDTVLVAVGTYFENLTWPVTQDIVLMSESGPDYTFIDGGDAGRVITIMETLDRDTKIHGFTIQHGYSVGAGFLGSGGGILCVDGASITIEGNTISENVTYATSGGGGGIGVAYCTPRIVGNVITGNMITSDLSGGAGISCRGADALIENNTITHNVIPSELTTAGGGVFLMGGTPVVVYNTIEQNDGGQAGGAVGWTEGTAPRIEGNLLHGNHARYGGAIYLKDSGGLIADNTITENSSAASGGAILSEVSSPTIRDNQITGNIGSSGGGIYCVGQRETGTTIIYHNMIKNNTSTNDRGGGIRCNDGAAPVIELCYIADNVGGGIHSSSDTPGLPGPTLLMNTICNNTPYGLRNDDCAITIDATNVWWGDPTGPYHAVYNPGGLCNAVSDCVLFAPWLLTGAGDTDVPDRATLAQNYPNPFNPMTVFQFTIPERQQVRLVVYGIAGRLIAKLVDEEIDAGAHRATWDGCDAQGREQASGTYVVRLETASGTESRKVTLVR